MQLADSEAEALVRFWSCQDSRKHAGPESGDGLHSESEVSSHFVCPVFHPQRVQCEHCRQDAHIQAGVCPGHVVSVLGEGALNSLEVFST